MTAIQSIASLFALVGVGYAGLTYRSQTESEKFQRDLQIRTLEGDNRPLLSVTEINSINTAGSPNIFQESCACITDYHYKKVFDIYPANKRIFHPLFVIKNTGKNFAENVIIKISGAAKIDNKIDFSSSNTIKEEIVSILEPDKWFFVRKDEKYKSTMFNFRENFGVQIEYESKILNKTYIDSYEAKVKCGLLIFVVKKDSIAWENISSKTINLFEFEPAKYSEMRSNWEKHNEVHLIRDHYIHEEKKYKYIQIEKKETQMFEDKYYNDNYVFIQKRGSFITSFSKISSEFAKLV